MCSSREEYLYRRLMELALITDTRELDDVERREELRLTKELKDILARKLGEK